jgi:hypothetical protein
MYSSLPTYMSTVHCKNQSFIHFVCLCQATCYALGLKERKIESLKHSDRLCVELKLAGGP